MYKRLYALFMPSLRDSNKMNTCNITTQFMEQSITDPVSSFCFTSYQAHVPVSFPTLG